MPRVLFARIGWMQFYDGPQPPHDPKPLAGGGYTVENLGHEVYNFREVDGYCCGYFKPTGTSEDGPRVSLDRIAAGCKRDSLSNVLIVFVARRPSGGGQYVVGWYRDAEVYRYRQPADSPDLDDYAYYCRTRSDHVVLLPPTARSWKIPNNRTFGQSNLCYSLNADGTPKSLEWQREIVERIEAYKGLNAFHDPVVEAEEIVSAVCGGQGYGLSPAQRRAVEDHAMKTAVKHFTGLGYEVEDTHKTEPYDLVCRKRNRLVYMEVKGTTGPPSQVFLTRNEVKHARKHKDDMILFLLSGICLDKATDKASGGQVLVMEHWCPEEGSLKALQYVFVLPESVLGGVTA